jgi:sec-independent protein translocase protein TatC
LALPIIVLYEISIWMAKLVERERAKREALLEQELNAPTS